MNSMCHENSLASGQVQMEFCFAKVNGAVKPMMTCCYLQFFISLEYYFDLQGKHNFFSMLQSTVHFNVRVLHFVKQNSI